MNIRWSCKKFADLSVDELYAILALRSTVFVVEQQCVFLDIDYKDQPGHHLMAWNAEKLVAYSRLLPAAVAYPQASIGRVVTASTVRGSGVGRQLMQRSIEMCYALYGKQPLRIGAQFHLRHFYASFGFKQVSEVYDEDGIDHIQMLKEE